MAQRNALHAAVRSAACLMLAAAVSQTFAATPVLKGQTDRALRYRPDNGAFVIDNGPDSFNRPLYGGNTAFRVDAGDRPEFSLYLPGRGGVVRVGIATPAGTKWLRDADHIEARYGDGAMRYRISDSSFAGTVVTLTAVAPRDREGLAVQATIEGGAADLLFAYGGMDGEKGKRDGDIGTESQPVSQFFALKADHCRDNKIETTADGFTLHGKAGQIDGRCGGGAAFAVADAKTWNDAAALQKSAGTPGDRPISLATVHASAGKSVIFLLQKHGDDDTKADGLEAVFQNAIDSNHAVATQVTVDTPDPFINAAVPALCLAADAIWDDASGTFMHGGVAWRRPYLGWRGPYAGDAAGWHDRTQSHLDAYFKKQNTKSDLPATQPAADEDQALARSERQLRSNGDLTDAHYDMNLVAVDVFFRHLLWTGDLDYARKNWPVIQRHLAWEQRLFRREFGPEHLPLYEAYAAIWASDDLQYSGGGTAHASAYNYYHNLMAARVAKLIGQDPAPYQHEASLIKKAMDTLLWQKDIGQYAECKDWLGNQLVHPDAALWTHYHTLDSQVPDAFQAYQMTRYVDTHIPHIPITGKDVPPGCFTLATSDWMPYTYSINNVVMAETEHTALADWQANRPDAAFSFYKGAILDSMFLGQCPGNCAMTSFFDPYRQEAQRDFGDPIGITWRATVEGLFGIKPDALAGELTIEPGFPADWDHAAFRHPDIALEYKRGDGAQTFSIKPKFAKPMRLRLLLPARGSHANVSVNGQSVAGRSVDDAVGAPQLEIDAEFSDHWDVLVTWSGEIPPTSSMSVAELEKHQSAARLHAGDFSWLRPIETGKYLPPFNGDIWSTMPGTNVGKDGHGTSMKSTDWGMHASASTKWDKLTLSDLFNDSVTSVFKNKYVSPRSPFCSLALPVQGFGGWSTNKTTPAVDDSGLRNVGGTLTLPQGVPFSTPSAADAKNVLFVSQWDNYPHEAVVPLTGKSGHAYFLMAGTTNWMQSHIDNGEVVVTYADGSTDRLALRNPETWWPIEQDYFVDDYAFNISAAIPPRVDLKTGKVRMPTRADLAAGKQKIDGGSATVLDLPLDPAKELKSLTVRAIANDVVIGLMGVTLQRPEAARSEGVK